LFVSLLRVKLLSKLNPPRWMCATPVSSSRLLDIFFSCFVRSRHPQVVIPCGPGFQQCICDAYLIYLTPGPRLLLSRGALVCVFMFVDIVLIFSNIFFFPIRRTDSHACCVHLISTVGNTIGVKQLPGLFQPDDRCAFLCKYVLTFLS